MQFPSTSLWRFSCVVLGLLGLIGLPAGLCAQSAPPDASVESDKRMFGVLSNRGTIEESLPYRPISSRQKMAIATDDTFDWASFALAGAFSGLGQLNNQNPSFGQGVKGYSKRLAGAYGDQAIGNMLSEGVLPSLLHEDPRYFRRGQGTGWSRFLYAATRVFVTRTDSGGKRFNFSELGGNTLAVAISNAYYPDARNVTDNVQKVGIQFATDMASNVLKEFWPDIKRRHRRTP
jgi:hypothetical protein